MIQRFRMQRLELGYEEARRAVLSASPEAQRYALAWLGYVTLEGVRYETIFVEGGERAKEQGATMGQRYKSRAPALLYEPIGNSMVLRAHENLLWLAGHSDAVTKLSPVVTRLKADIAHHSGRGGREALTYSVEKDSAVYLGLDELDRPFRKELQKEPDTVHVVIGPNIWALMFKPSDKEVFLVRDSLVPMGRTVGPFPGFKEDGSIIIGYAPPQPTGGEGDGQYDVLVLWSGRFKIKQTRA